MPTHHRASRRIRNSATVTTFRPDFPARLNLVCTRTSGLACTTSHGILFEMNLSLNSLCDDVPAGALQALTQHWLDLFRQAGRQRSEEHTSELQSLMRISYAVFCLKNKTKQIETYTDR